MTPAVEQCARWAVPKASFTYMSNGAASFLANSESFFSSSVNPEVHRHRHTSFWQPLSERKKVKESARTLVEADVFEEAALAVLETVNERIHIRPDAIFRHWYLGAWLCVRCISDLAGVATLKAHKAAGRASHTTNHPRAGHAQIRILN